MKEGVVVSFVVPSTWQGTLRCVLGQDALLAQYLSPPRCINGYGQVVRETTNCGKETCDELASHPGKKEVPLAASCYRNWNKLRQL